MKKNLLRYSLLFMLLYQGLQQLSAQVISIATARTRDTGTVVTVSGIVTSGSELGVIRYFQDATAGLAAYQVGTIMDTIRRGDSIVITGKLTFFRNLLQLQPVTSVQVISRNNPLPAPKELRFSQVADTLESQLVTYKNIFFRGIGNFVGNTNYRVFNGTDSTEVRVANTSNLVGTLIPVGLVHTTGILSQFCISPAIGCRTGYQLLLRDRNDITPVSNLYFTATPTQSNISGTGFRITWKTNRASSTILRYGTSTALGSIVNVPPNDTLHIANLTNLSPATLYYVQAVSIVGTDTAVSNIYPMMTASTSSGEMRIYFNNRIDASFALNGAIPNAVTGAASETALVNLINNATTSVDVMMYNNGSSAIVTALKSAAARGVRVRYIADRDATNAILTGQTLGFQVIRNNITGVDGGLMHNKVFIVDVGNAQNAWVTSGSMNLTEGQIYTDPNNMLFIQDQSLAKAYTMEFEEMWGSSTATPDMTLAKFGIRKSNNTPHLFSINGKPVELYFSPSDQTADQIAVKIGTANTSLDVAAHGFTDNPLGTAVKLAKDRRVNVRVLVRDTSEQGSEVPYLVSNGVTVRRYPTGTIFHHKYCIIDANQTNSNPIVVTGSHNWSASADEKNDENTLILEDERITNIFKQEFEARWCESTPNCRVSTQEHQSISGFDATIFPNPTQDVATVNMTLESPKDVTIRLTDALGRTLQATILSNVSGNIQREIHTAGLPSGLYFVVFSANNQVTAKRLQIVK